MIDRDALLFRQKFTDQNDVPGGVDDDAYWTLIRCSPEECLYVWDAYAFVAAGGAGVYNSAYLMIRQSIDAAPTKLHYLPPSPDEHTAVANVASRFFWRDLLFLNAGDGELRLTLNDGATDAPCIAYSIRYATVNKAELLERFQKSPGNVVIAGRPYP